MITLSGIPVIETERLILRGPQLSDFEAFAAFIGSDRAASVGGPINRNQAWRSFTGSVGHWVLRGFGSFIFTERGTGTVLGRSGCIYQEGWPEPELGWSVWDARAEGKGYAFEATEAVRAWAYRELGWTTAISLISEKNTRSQALARRLGAVPEREATVTGQPCVIWRHPSPDTLADGGMEAYA